MRKLAVLGIRLETAMDKPNHPEVLDGWLEAPELAVQIDRHERTLARWRKRGIGPAYAMLGVAPVYHIDDVRTWLRAGGGAAPPRPGPRTKRGRPEQLPAA